MYSKNDASVGIIGAGPVGLALSAQLANFGIKTIVLDKLPALQKKGSKACLIQGDVLEILEKIGCAENLAYEGIHWRVAHTYFKDVELIAQEYPERVGFGPFVNISQYRIEQELLNYVENNPCSKVLWNHDVISIIQDSDFVTIEVQTADEIKKYDFKYLVACDGVRSSLRDLTGVEYEGYTHQTRFLITDIKANIPMSKERHFYFDSSFHPGKQMVMHPQPDNIWRIDWQLGKDSDIDQEKENGILHERIRKVIGDIPYNIEWLSTYRFNQKVIKDFRLNRVFFAGDAAHSFPPYGSRGMNSGIQDADNLAWKLAFVLNGFSKIDLLETYHQERYPAALENLRVTEATMRFIAPLSRTDRFFRSTVLKLSHKFKWMRGWINHGKMAEPFTYKHSEIIGNNHHPLIGQFSPDARIFVNDEKTRLRKIFGTGFTCILFANSQECNIFGEMVSKLALPFTVKFIVAIPRGEEKKISLINITIANYDDILTYKQFYVGMPVWFIIRPDGHIASQQRFADIDQMGMILKKYAMSN